MTQTTIMHVGNFLLIIFFISSFVKDAELVINGRVAKAGDFPYVASLRRLMKGHQCGSAIISRRFLLSAAHCFYNENEALWMIKMGVVNSFDGGAKIFQVKKFHLRDDYKPAVYRQMTLREKNDMLTKGRFYTDTIVVEETKHDIAVVEAMKSFSFDLLELPLPQNQQFLEILEYTTIAIIKRAEEPPPPCAICVFAGWGNSVEGATGPGTENLMYSIIRVHNHDDCCRENCQHEPDVICAQNPSRNAVPSFGDSGGPLICNGHLAGIISSGHPYGDEVTNYVDVAYYKGWIDDIITETVPGEGDVHEEL